MYDINFYMKSYYFLKDIQESNFCSLDVTKDFCFNVLETKRCREPVVYNIETTNNCEHRCIMCPRTTRMTRKIKTMSVNDFKKIISQIAPWSEREWNKWKLFCEEEYDIKENDMSENHFFLYIIPQVIQLHGYGHELLNKNIDKFVQVLTDNGFKSYFSCNPTNLNLERVKKCFDAGMSYIKFSIESVNDKLHQKIRGNDKFNFQKSYEDILKLLEYKKEKNYNTVIVITMLDLDSNWEKQEEEFKKLKEYFDDKDFYVYKKSLDTQWYVKNYHPNISIHWQSICKHPWMSMTIKSNGEAASCMEDFNNSVVLGDTNKDSLYDIWNGEKYKQFRLDHINNRQDFRCGTQCDMSMIGNYL